MSSSDRRETGVKEVSMRSFRVCSLLVVAVFIAGTGVAHAGRSSNMAATCIVGDPAIQGNLYTIASGSVRHQAGKTGTNTLYCPISTTIIIVVPMVGIGLLGHRWRGQDGEEIPTGFQDTMDFGQYLERREGMLRITNCSPCLARSYWHCHHFRDSGSVSC